MAQPETPPPRSVAITGASGLVGRQVVAHLAAEPGTVERILALDVRPPNRVGRLAGVSYEEADVRDSAFGKRFEAHDVDTVIHLAAIVTPGRHSSRENEYAVDVRGTQNVLDGCLAHGVRQLVYLSSGAAYGYHADNPVPLREGDPLRGNRHFAYAWHKRLVEEMLARARAERPDLLQLVFRPGTILGASVASPITAMFERRFLVGVAGSDAPFVLIWDEDVADCILKGVRERCTGVYNLAGDGALSLPEVARRLGKPYVPLPAWLVAGALRALQALGFSARGPEQVDFLRYRPVLANDALKQEFGFAPRFTSEECFEHYRRLRFAQLAPGP